MKLALLVCSLLFSYAIFAAPCPDISGVYGHYYRMGGVFQVKQLACASFQLTQIIQGKNPVTDDIKMDGVYRVLPSMPQFQTAFTYNPNFLIGTSKDIKTGLVVRRLIFSLDGARNLIEQTEVLDGFDKVISSRSDVVPRCPAGDNCMP